MYKLLSSSTPSQEGTLATRLIIVEEETTPPSWLARYRKRQPASSPIKQVQAWDVSWFITSTHGMVRCLIGTDQCYYWEERGRQVSHPLTEDRFKQWKCSNGDIDILLENLRRNHDWLVGLPKQSS
jgi:hypothetical protein